MANAAVFDFVCEQLEARTSFDRLTARGTVRIALKQAGLDAGAVTARQMRVVLERVLAAELAARGVANAIALCDALAQRVAGMDDGGTGETPDAVFRRLGGGA